MNRTDYAFPFRIDPISGQATQSPYATHVDQMIRQVLLTTPGEGVDLPEFGCGLRDLLFAPKHDALEPTTRLTVQKALNDWLAGQVQVVNVDVSNGNGDGSEILVVIEYLL